jgi:NADP-dependent 3-hydroxy acid dehydrogenase YdfG
VAASRGANVVAVARNEVALCELVDEINASGGSAIYAVADVADEEALQCAAETARQQFGSIDTWVNNAGTSILRAPHGCSHRRLAPPV